MDSTAIIYIIVASLSFIAVLICLIDCSKRSGSQVKRVRDLLALVLFPIIGNILMINNRQYDYFSIGIYIYLIGFCWLTFGLYRLVEDYCNSRFKKIDIILLLLMIADTVSLLLNIKFHHVFTIASSTNEQGVEFFRISPDIPYNLHFVLGYYVFVNAIVILIYKIAKSDIYYAEKYFLMLICVIVEGLFEVYYQAHRDRYDFAIVGYAVYAIIIYYLVIFHAKRLVRWAISSNLINEVQEAFFYFNSDRECIYVNKLGKDKYNVTENDDEKIMELVEKLTFRKGRSFEEDIEIRRAHLIDGKKCYIQTSFKKVLNKKGVPVGAFFSIKDCTAEEEQRAREEYILQHDRLTGLYNRDALYLKIEQRMKELPDQKFTAITLDIRNFKMINDIYGTQIGDRMLNLIADFLRSIAKPYVLYGRMSADKFGIFLPEGIFQPYRLINELNEVLNSQREKWFNYEVRPLLGIYNIKDDTDTSLTVIFGRTSMALSYLKKQNTEQIKYYDDSMRNDLINRQNILNELRNAILNRKIVPYLQPQVDENGKIIGAEALARWINDDGSIKSPIEFIPILEETGRIVQVDIYIWEYCCKLLKKWKDDPKKKDLHLSINISRIDFYYIDVYGVIAGLVKEYDIKPSKLHLEITETAVMEDVEDKIEVIEKFKKDGFVVEMDDFGSGYSSLNMLKDIKVNVLKLDMKFLSKSNEPKRAVTIVNSMIELGKKLDIEILTEGVEEASQFKSLVDMGCKMFQGFYFARPMPVEKFIEGTR